MLQKIAVQKYPPESNDNLIFYTEKMFHMFHQDVFWSKKKERKGSVSVLLFADISLKLISDVSIGLKSQAI